MLIKGLRVDNLRSKLHVPVVYSKKVWLYIVEPSNNGHFRSANFGSYIYIGIYRVFLIQR